MTTKRLPHSRHLMLTGILVGVDLLMTGISMIALATTVGRLAKLTNG